MLDKMKMRLLCAVTAAAVRDGKIVVTMVN